MNSKTYLYSKALIKSDLKRFWWVSALYMVIMALFILPNAIGPYDDITTTLTYNTDEGMLSLFFAFILGGLLFSYLHKGNSVSFMNSIPVNKNSQFISHCISGIILLAVPVIISSIVMGCQEMYFGNNAKYAVKYLYTCFVYASCAFTLTTFTTMVSGNIIAAYTFGFGCIVLPYFLINIINFIFTQNIYGFSSYSLDIIYYIYLTGIHDVFNIKSLVYIVLTLIMLVLSVILYRNRKLENYGEIVVFKYLKPVFMYTVAVIFGFLGYSIMDSIHNNINLFIGTVPLGVVALVAAFMLNKKSFDLKGIIKPLAIYFLFIGAINIAIATDITGYEKRIPEYETIKGIDIYEDINRWPFSDESAPNYGTVAFKGAITDKKDMDTIMNFHKGLILRGNEKIEEATNSKYAVLYVDYQLKNNQKVKRKYTVKTSDLMEVYNIENFRKVLFPVLNDNKKKLEYFDIDDERIGTGIKANVDVNQLYSALEKDVMSMSAEEIMDYQNGNSGCASINIAYKEYITYNNKTYTYHNNDTIMLNSHFKNTVALLETAEYKSRFLPISNVNELNIDYTFENQSTKNVIITDKEDIKAILESVYDTTYCDPNDSRNDYVRLSIFSKDLSSAGDGYLRPYLPLSQVSPALKKYMK